MDQPTKNEFETLLKWLSPNREEAAAKYDLIRNGLLRFFRYRGCSDPQTLSDKTIDRVAQKLGKLELRDSPKKSSVFFGFAYNIYREHLRNPLRKEIQLEFENQIDHSRSIFPYDSDKEKEVFKCLDACLDKLNEKDRDLILRYYSKEKREKIELRSEIANELGVRLKTLHVRMYRLRETIEKCLEKCISKEKR